MSSNVKDALIAWADTLVTDEEATRLVLNLLTTRGDQGATEDEMNVVVGWARAARGEQAFLDLALKGMVSVDVRDGEVAWKISPEGRRIIEAAAGK